MHMRTYSKQELIAAQAALNLAIDRQCEGENIAAYRTAYFAECQINNLLSYIPVTCENKIIPERDTFNPEGI